MKALEKDRTRRYETANGLAMDIQRYLHNEPVVARPPSTIYKFQKLALRNKTIFAAAGAGMAALIIGLILSLFLYAQEKAALKRAIAAEQSEKQLRQQAEQIADMSRVISRAGLLLMSAKYDESEKALRGIRPHDTLVPFYNVFGNAHARRGEWLESLTNWNYVVQFAPADHIGYQYLAPLLVQMNNLDGYKNFREQILRQFGDTTDSRIAERMVKASLILPAPADEMTVISKMAAVAGNVGTNEDRWGYNFLAKGLSEYRSGNYNEAVHLLQRVLPEDIGSRPRTEAYLILAMAQHQLNQPEASRASFAKAMEVVNKLPKGGDFDDDWHDWIIIHVLLREALGLNPNFANSDSSAAATPQKIETPAWQEALAKAGWKFKSQKAEDGSWEVDLEDQPVTDISVLHGVDINDLSLMHTAVSNLEPLRGMPLKKLRLASTRVTDLSPLQGMPLIYLQLSGTAVANLEPLRGMPLLDLRMTDCTNITSLEPISGNKTLENVILPPNAKGFEFLRGLTSLKRLSFRYDSEHHRPAQSAAEFWADYDRAKQTKRNDVSEVTRILESMESGNEKGAEELLPLVYEELRKLAAAKMANESSTQTLQPTALVHEAWLRMTGNENVKWNGRAHFFGAAAEAMRRILIDNARRKRALRHGGDQKRIDLQDIDIAEVAKEDELLDMNDALEEFSAIDKQKAELVKLRYFIGLSVDEAAAILGVSVPTANRWWVFARAWLYENIRSKART